MVALRWETGTTDGPRSSEHKSRQQTDWAGGRSLALEDLDSCLFQGPGLASEARTLSREKADCNPRGPFN